MTNAVRATTIFGSLLAVSCSSPPPPATGETVGVANVTSSYFHVALENRTGAPAATFHLGRRMEGAALPCAGDFDGDGFDGIALYHTGLGDFEIADELREDAPTRRVPAIAGTSLLPVCGDFDGDGIDTFGLYDFLTREVRLFDGAGAVARTFTFDAPLGFPIAGDFDDDGRDTFGVFDPVLATFTLESGGGTTAIAFGDADDRPIVGDFDGDGRDDLGVMDPLTGRVRLRREGALPIELDLPIADAGIGDFPSQFPIAGRFRDSGARAEDDGYEWPTSTPAAEGFDGARIDAAIASARGLPYLHSLLVVRRGNLVVEEYFHGFHRGMANNVQSVSKSVLSLLYGIAVRDGVGGGARVRVADVLPMYFPATGDDPRRREIYVDQLLSMSSGLAWSEVYPLREWYESPDLVGYVLGQPIEADPGTTFEYSTGTSYVAGAVLEQLIGEPLDDFARRELFAPLGISLVRWDPVDGIPHGGSSMYIRPRDLARIGELVVRGGALDGRTIVTPEWMDASTSPLLAVNPADASEGSYGLHWWIGESGGVRVVQARGIGGQFIVIIPSLELVVVTTSVWYLSGAEADRSWDDAQTLIGRDVLPALTL
jgi:CubicO group peptidase (beta-lactamase class C family)